MRCRPSSWIRSGTGTVRLRVRRIGIRLAWISLWLSFPVWTAALFVPLLPFDVATRVAIASACIVAGEVMFWGAGAVLGVEATARFRPPRVTNGRSFAGKRVVVIGATGALGSATARALAREGAQLVLAGRDPTSFEALSREHGAESVFMDLFEAPSIEEAAEQILGGGRPDHIVCAAGVDLRKTLLAHTVQEIDTEISLDLRAPILVVRAFLSRMAEHGSISLLGGFGEGNIAFPYHSPDVATRAGLAAFCESINRELILEGRSQSVGFVCPAPLDTVTERPLGSLWTRLGSRRVTPESAADFILQSLLMRRTRRVMGLKTMLLSKINAISPAAADLMVLHKVGILLRERWGGKGDPSSRT